MVGWLTLNFSYKFSAQTRPVNIMGEYRCLYYALIILQSIASSTASHVLAIFPIQSRSHFAMHRTLMEGLASRGHPVTVFSYFNETVHKENYTPVYIGNLGDNMDSFIDTITPDMTKDFTGLNYLLNYLWSPVEDEDICGAVYSHDYIRNIVKGNSEPPDLLIVEFYHVPCFSSLAEKFDIPVIAIVPPTHIHGVDYSIGNTLHPAYWPSLTSEYSQTMNFHQRLINSLHYIAIYAVHHLRTVNTLVKLDKNYIGNADVTVEKLNRRISLAIYNNHFSFLNRPSVPNAIEIGGGLIEQAKPLPAEIKKFIDESEDGVIYFSFGTTLKFSSMPEQKIELFKKAFSQISQRVLWRSDQENLTDVSPNVMIRKWFPQRDILEHQNVKAFVSHGGLFGVFEAIHTGTPIIGIPFFYDQYSNVNILREKGMAIALDYDSLAYDTFLKALKDIVNERRYRENTQKYSSILKDRPMPALDTAIYWIEYVIRHKGAPHLRVASADMPFYEFLLLDVIGFILFSAIIIVSMLYYIVKIIAYSCRRYVVPKKNKIQ